MEDITKNPWLGLKSYSEGKRLYGRDLEIDELSQKIIYNTQTVVYGKSGIGKSSLLKAGVFPVLRRNGYFPVYVRFVHEDGEDSYTQQIINAVEIALKKLKVENLRAPEGDIYQIVEGYKEEVVSAYHEGSETMWEYFHRHRFYYQLNENEAPCLISPVLVFDQFEEIFTLQKDERLMKDFFVELSSLLNNICPDYLLQPTIEVNEAVSTSVGTSLIKKGVVSKTKRKDYIDETNLHVVLSLREDCLFYLERNTENIPSLKHNRYCLLPLNEDQAAEVIMRPIPGLVSKDVTKEIISKVTGKSVNEFEIDDNPELEVNSSILSLFLSELYEKKGNAEVISHKLVDEFGSNIIFDFYVRKIEDRTKISDKSVHFLERRLVTADTNGTGRRDNIYVDQAYKHGITKQEIKYLCDECRLLHQYPWRDGMRIELSHDVLCEVVTKRRNQREEEQKRVSQKAQLEVLKRRNNLIVSFVIFIIFIGVGYYFAKLHPISEKYASTIKCYGMIQGVEKLTEEQASYRDYHFILKKKGYVSKIYHSMECRDKFNRLCTDHNLDTYLGNNDTSLLVSSLQSPKVCKWEFIADPVIETKVIQERAYDNNNTLIYAFNYNLPSVLEDNEKTQKMANTQKNDNVIIGTYVDAQGLPMQILKEGYRFIKISRDDLGHDMIVEYFDMKGNQATNADQAYQTLYEYDALGNQISQFSLNRYGKRMVDAAGNCGMIHKYDGYRRVESISVNEYGFEHPVDNAFTRVLYEYDDYGRQIRQSFWNYDTACVYEKFGYHEAMVIYDDNQYSREVILFDNQGDTISYDKVINDVKTNRKGETISEYMVYIASGDTLTTYKFKKDKNTQTREWGGSENRSYINKEVYDKKGRIIEDAYFELDGITPYEDKYVHHKTRSYFFDNSNSYREESKFLMKEDSIVHYSKDNNVIAAYVDKYYPTRQENITVSYKNDTHSDSLLVSNQAKYILRIDGSRLEQHDLNTNRLKYRFIVNEKSKAVEDAIGPLTRYGFPYPSTSYGDFGYFNSGVLADENGGTRRQSLPQIYTDNRNFFAVFIEYIDKIGRRSHAVLLESDAGVCFGEDTYDYNNFGQDDDVICLDLLTMKIKSLSLYDEDVYWSIYNFPITTLEYEIYQRHYDKYKNENPNYEKPIYMKSVVHGRVEGADGYLPENGHNGSYFILKWCDWDCSQSIDKFAEEFENSREKNKDIILLPYEIVNDSMLFLEPISISCLSGLLGLRITEESVTYSCYKEDILGTYNAMN